MRPAKTLISLGICPVWSESLLSPWRKLGFLSTYWAHSEDTDQTGQMPRLIWIFAGCTRHFVGFVMRWLNYLLSTCYFWIFVSCIFIFQGRLVLGNPHWWTHCSTLILILHPALMTFQGWNSRLILMVSHPVTVFYPNYLDILITLTYLS